MQPSYQVETIVKPERPTVAASILFVLAFACGFATNSLTGSPEPVAASQQTPIAIERPDATSTAQTVLEPLSAATSRTITDARLLVQRLEPLDFPAEDPYGPFSYQPTRSTTAAER